MKPNFNRRQKAQAAHEGKNLHDPASFMFPALSEGFLRQIEMVRMKTFAPAAPFCGNDLK
jgi:hypothetical protein